MRSKNAIILEGSSINKSAQIHFSFLWTIPDFDTKIGSRIDRYPKPDSRNQFSFYTQNQISVFSIQSKLNYWGQLNQCYTISDPKLTLGFDRSRIRYTKLSFGLNYSDSILQFIFKFKTIILPRVNFRLEHINLSSTIKKGQTIKHKTGQNLFLYSYETKSKIDLLGHNL